MELFNQDLMYEFYVRDLSHTEALKQYADCAVRDIKALAGWDVDVQVHIEPEAKDKHLFSVSISVLGMGEAVIIKKEGKHVLAVLKKVRKAVVRQMHRLNRKKMSVRRKRFFKQQFAS